MKPMPRSAIINSRWIALDPTHRIDAGHWLRIHERLESQGIDPNVATDDQVKTAIALVTSGGGKDRKP